MTGNHISDQAQKENDKRGECPRCGRGIMEACEVCHDGTECSFECVASDGCCPDVTQGSKCSECGYISKP